MTKRIITCQGTSQLITAIGALNYEQHLRGESRDRDEYHLLIYDLCAPDFQSFDCVIRQMAEALIDWTSITSISDLEMKSLRSLLSRHGATAVIQRLHSITASNAASVVYLCRNWGFGNELVLNAYPKAEKVCYGDGFGHFTGRINVSAPSVEWPWYKKIRKRISRSFRKGLRNLRSWTRYGTRFTGLADLDFDVGYFGQIRGWRLNGEPAFPWQTVNREYHLEVVKKLRSSLTGQPLEELRLLVDRDGGCSVLLGENLSEAGDATRDDEISLYREFVRDKNVPPGSLLLYKPHPRDNPEKVRAVAEALSSSGYKTRTLDAPELSHLPFELLFTSLFLDQQMNLSSNVKILTSGFPAIPLMYLFGVCAKDGYGYGPALVEKYLAPEVVPVINEYEQFALDEIDRWRRQLQKAA